MARGAVVAMVLTSVGTTRACGLDGTHRRTDASVVGALNPFAADSRILTDDDVRVGQARADVATVGLRLPDVATAVTEGSATAVELLHGAEDGLSWHGRPARSAGPARDEALLPRRPPQIVRPPTVREWHVRRALPAPFPRRAWIIGMCICSGMDRENRGTLEGHRSPELERLPDRRGTEAP